MADVPDTPMNVPAPATPEPKSAMKSKTMIFLALAALTSVGLTLIRAFPDYEWLYEPINQLQLFFLAGAGVTRATATVPLK